MQRLRTQRGITLAALAETTGIAKSTLSRLETGQRRPSLELLLPISQAHQVPLDELAGAPDVGHPGRLRVILADHDLTLGTGEAAEFDTRLPHWFGSTGHEPAEILSIFGRQGERIHIRAKPATTRRTDHSSE